MSQTILSELYHVRKNLEKPRPIWHKRPIYCYSETDLWYGNWNLHVCHERKYEVDRASRSTEENPGKKQKWCSMSCLWFKFNGIHLTKVILKLWVVYGQKIIDVPICEIEQRCQLFPAGWEQSLLHMSREICRLKRDTIGSQWNTDYLLEPPPPPKKKKSTTLVSTRNSSILMMPSSEYLILESESSFLDEKKPLKLVWPDS